jgi:hypothetical protein
MGYDPGSIVVESQRKYKSMNSRSHKQFIANLLGPRMRTVAQNLYRRANYLYYGERHFRYALHPDVGLITPAQWAGLDEPNNQEAFFGYYDKTPWSPDGGHFLLHRPQPNGSVAIVLYDQQARAVRTIATSSAWNYQQGSMTQWMGDGREPAIIFNDYVQDNLVGRIAAAASGAARQIPWPIQVVHPAGSEALTLNYCRLDQLRPDYGYNAQAANFNADQPPTADGIWHIDLNSGQAELRLTLAQLANLSPREEMRGARHKVNHFYYAPNGERFVFMHRWLGAQGKFSRLYVADKAVGNLKLLLDDQMVSHYSWQDNDHLLAWARTRQGGDHYYLINVRSGDWQIIGEGVLDAYDDGHPTFSPDGRWIATDSYPDKARQRHLLLFNLASGKLVQIGRFFAPWQFSGVVRCDLHPRWSPDGRFISIDSAHEGVRQSYILDVSSIVNG